MANDQTAHYKFPLPHRENLLSEDVDRLRESLTAADRAIYEAAQEAAEATAVETTARENAITAEAQARAAEKENTDAQLKKLRTLALAGL
ncbi:hypothetical protein [Cardiobacterium valvarum]|uniref:Uncharacterized protein n=1 Tax=Cardiobacterium valvarum TaxID=194702 RepID=A0A381ECE7_9GAMM|nr:hypothetical protein [Cardiobacterium valvarum]SUX24553.1 Uncharacterised protein [Cardiobacterium valvarum]